jgi:hypothetical protein
MIWVVRRAVSVFRCCSWSGEVVQVLISILAMVVMVVMVTTVVVVVGFVVEVHGMAVSSVRLGMMVVLDVVERTVVNLVPTHV